MLAHQLQSQSLKRPKFVLFLAFLTWKAILLLIAFLSPGDGYDTSTQLLRELPLRQPLTSDFGHHDSPLKAFLVYVCTKLTRWDAIYFVETARRGYIHEQEWAFGWGFATFIRTISKGTISPSGKTNSF